MLAHGVGKIVSLDIVGKALNFRIILVKIGNTRRDALGLEQDVVQLI
jgi:hypothetical protein